MSPTYDGALGMFREEARPMDYGRLQFLRWLSEQGRLEHPTAGAPSGPFADALRQMGAPVTAPPPAPPVRGGCLPFRQRLWA